jgi:putative transposase
MKTDTIKATEEAAEATLFLGDDWFDPLEAGVRTRIRGFIEELLEAELDAALGRDRYERPRLAEAGVGGGPVVGAGHRHGHRERQLMGTFGPATVRVPRARLETSEGKTVEWKNATIPAYQRRTKQADALIAGAYLAGTNTRRVRRALTALFGGAVGKDTVSRVWRKVKGDWDAWNVRSLKDEPIIRLILDGTIVRVRLDRKATSISLLVALGVRQDGQKILLAVKNMGGESEAAWRTLLDDLVKRGLKTPQSPSSTARPASRKPSPRSGPACWFSAARCISTVIFSPMHPTGRTRKSPPITTI